MSKYSREELEEIEERYHRYAEEPRLKYDIEKEKLLERINYSRENSLFDFLLKYKNDYYESSIKEIEYFSEFSKEDLLRQEYELYNKMTDKEVEEYIELDLRNRYKEALIEAKKASIMISHITDKKIYSDEIVCKVVELEYQDEKDIKKKNNILSQIKRMLKTIFDSGVKGFEIGAFIGLIASLVSGEFNVEKVLEFSGGGALVFVIAVLASAGLLQVATHIVQKNSVDIAKETGLYDMTLESLKNKEELNKFILNILFIEKEKTK